ncbi:nitrilase-related carbon-nitrogen hydrolase [Azospirillum sp. A39]|uniref:nitrilase-related carbon-nitrogen hydrolase n=1 Tax=Azospirillum sp. A39 TaxID=3462279 RepID=UPI004046863D
MRVAIAPVPGSSDGAAANLELLASCARGAAAEDADLLLLSALFLCGCDGAQSHCEPFDGPSLEAACRVARSSGVALLFGFAERAGSAVYNAAAFVGPDGAPLGTYRKAHLAPAEKGCFTAGQGMPALARVAGMTVGALIGCDADFPEPARDLALRGCDAVVVLAGGEDSPRTRLMLPARACENQLYVVGVLGADSRLYAPDGQPAPAEARAGLLIADLDPGARRSASRAMDYLAERRPALYARLAERRGTGIVPG